jgi:predicted DNA-binding transcriptional regulator AlpA
MALDRIVQEQDRIVRERERRAITGIGRSTAYPLERSGEFPRRVKLPGGRVGWRLSELQEWVRSRPTVVVDDPPRG